MEFSKNRKAFNTPIIYQDSNFLVVNKPAGLQVHPDSHNKTGTLADFLLEIDPQLKKVGEDPQRPGIVHRLDKNTSGLLLIARNQPAFLYFKSQFQKRLVKKTYWALVHGNPPKKSGKVDQPIGRSLKRTQVRTTASYAKDQKSAQTFYQVLKKFNLVRSPSRQFPYTLLEVFPRTGRTHQIRVHLKSIGCPIVGDPLYKFKRLVAPPKLKRMFLIAKKIEFVDPKGKKRQFQIELDPDLKKVLNDLEKTKT